MVIPAGWGALGFTSGRRTYLGNKRVGGVQNSNHLNGTAADFTASEGALRSFFGPNVHILNEGDHRHVSGLSDVPYYGQNGVAGLVNGVDTSAPKGATMLQPRKPPVQQPQPLIDAPLGFMNAPSPISQMNPQVAALPELQAKPQGHGKQALGAILGILGDSLARYGGQPGVYAPFMMQERQNEAEDNRFQQHLAAQQGLALYRAQLAATTPPKPTQTDRYVQEVLDPHTPAPRRQLLMQILTRPLMTVGADGSQTAQYGAAPDQGGDDEWEYNN